MKQLLKKAGSAHSRFACRQRMENKTSLFPFEIEQGEWHKESCQSVQIQPIGVYKRFTSSMVLLVLVSTFWPRLKL